MNIDNNTPFTVGTLLWEDLKGKSRLTVIVKGTFSLKTGEAVNADEQLPVFTADEHYGDDPLASVRFESDLAPYKPFADIALVGHAYAPDGKPVSKLDIGLRVGEIQKVVRVFGDRKWRFPSRLSLIPIISSPKYFITRELIYENSYGGIDESTARYCKENPIGRGFIGKKTKQAIQGKPLPNIEDPRKLISSWRSRPKPVGFGFYGRGWWPRLRHAGTYDEKHEKERAPELPVDFSYGIFNGAHPDLQVKGYLRGDEPVVLKNLSPDPIIRLKLPGVFPKIVVSKWTVPPDDWIEKKAMEGQEVNLEQVPTNEEIVKSVLDTLVFVPDKGIFYEVFRGVNLLNGLEELEVAKIKISLKT
jgi:hypothetical protein